MKRFGDNFLNKIQHKYWGVFVGYLYIIASKLFIATLCGNVRIECEKCKHG